MKYFFVSSVFFLALQCCATTVLAKTITTLTIHEIQGITISNYPLTFGHIFKKGDVPEFISVKANGKLLTTQCDVKRRWPDHSLKHAVISVVVPAIPAHGVVTLSLETSSQQDTGGSMVKKAVLATDVESNIVLKNISGSGYSGTVSASLRNAIEHKPLRYWLKGPVCTEIIARQIFSKGLTASWEVRFYPETSYGIRVAFSVENMQSKYRGDVRYDVTVSQGHAHPVQTLAERGVYHNHNSRWRRITWIGDKPPEVRLQYDFQYLQSTNLIYHYDDTLHIPPGILSRRWEKFLVSDLRLTGPGIVDPRMGKAGDREDIGPLPAWTVYWLYTMDNRMRKIMLDSAERGAHFQVHLIENDPGKKFYGHIVSIDDRPRYQSFYDKDNGDGKADNLPPFIGKTDFSIYEADKAHQPSFAYIPYIITGDRFYLDEMYHWAGWSLLSIGPNSSWGRDYNKGLVRVTMMARATAWALRNIADVAAIAPKEEIEQQYFENKLKNNIHYLVSRRIRETPLGTFGWTRALQGVDKSVTHVTSPWMEDYLAFSTTHILDMGYTTIEPWVAHAAKFIIGTIIDPEVNPYNGPGYRYPVEQNNKPLVSLGAANALIKSQPNSFPKNDYPESYRFSRIGALRVLEKYNGASKAVAWMLQHVDRRALAKWRENPKYALIAGKQGSEKSITKRSPVSAAVQ